MAYKALYNESWPIDFLLNKKNIIRDLRNNDNNMIESSKENQTFHDNAEKDLNKLPWSIREKSNYKTFCSMTKMFFNDKGLRTKIMSLWIIVMYQLHITLIFSLCPFEVSLPYKCLWYIMWITIFPDFDHCFLLRLLGPKSLDFSRVLSLILCFLLILVL